MWSKTGERVSIFSREKWIYAEDPRKGYKCIEEFLQIGEKKIRLKRPILEASSDWYLALRTKDRLYVYDLNGEKILELKAKASSIHQKEGYLAFSKKKKVEIIDIESKSTVFSKKLKSKLNSVFINKTKILAGGLKGLYAVDFEGDLIWELDIGPIYFIRAGNIIVAAKDNRIFAISNDGEILWKYDLNDVVYKAEIGKEDVKIYSFNTGLLTFTLDGKLESIEDINYEYKFLPYPELVSQRLLNDLKSKLKKVKKIKERKEIKKSYKNIRKMIKKEKYGIAYNLSLKTLEKLKKAQFQVLVPKKIYLGKSFDINLRFFNFFDENVENIVVDFTDFEKYFDIPVDVMELPPLRKDMYLERKIKAFPKYEGKFTVTVNIISSVGEFRKNLNVEVKRRRFLFFFREKRKSLLDLLEGT